MRNRGQQRASPFVVPALRTHRSLCNPRGWVRGAYGTLSALGQSLLQTSLDETRLRRAKGRCPSALPTRDTLDPG